MAEQDIHAEAEGPVKDVITQVARERFPDGRVVSVDVERDVDFDGMPIIVVKLVIDRSEAKLDTKRVSGFTRHVRSKLAEINEFSFPLFSFISESELKGASPEAA